MKKFPQWRAKVIGDEKREKIPLDHKNADILGFLNHDEVLKIFEKITKFQNLLFFGGAVFFANTGTTLLVVQEVAETPRHGEAWEL